MYTQKRKAKPIRKTHKANDPTLQIRKLYPRIQRDRKDHTGEYPGHKITYGEMEYAGLDHLLGHLQTRFGKTFDAFLDVGSGRGKLVLYMAAKPPIHRSVGIELVRERHQDAVRLLRRLPRALQGKVVLRQGDVGSVDVAALFPAASRVLVWFSNLCFEASGTDAVFRQLCRELPPGSVIALSKEPRSGMAKKLGGTTAAMSWKASSQVHLYEVP